MLPFLFLGFLLDATACPVDKRTVDMFALPKVGTRLMAILLLVRTRTCFVVHLDSLCRWFRLLGMYVVLFEASMWAKLSLTRALSVVNRLLSTLNV